MGQADDIRSAILHAVKAPEEVARLRKNIEATLELLRALGEPEAHQMTIRQGTPQEAIHTMCLLKDSKPYGQMWLDSLGALWYFGFGEEYTEREVDLIAMPAIIVNMYNNRVESFRLHLQS